MRDAASQQVVQPGDPSSAPPYFRLLLLKRLPLDRHAWRIDFDAAGRDNEGVFVSTMFGFPHLHNLKEALLLARRLTMRERDETINDRKQRIGCDLFRSVFPDKKRGGLPSMR